MGYVPYNPNPAGHKVGDCVVRALTVALDADWNRAYLELAAQGYAMKNMPSADKVWGQLLKDRGFHRRGLIDTCPDCYTVEEFAYDHPSGLYILGTGRHAVAVESGQILDSWNSGDKTPLFYFGKE